MDEINELNNLMDESGDDTKHVEWQGCLNCKFGYPVPDTDLVKCRRHPPQISENLFRFPRLHYQEWCGEWKYNGHTIIPDGVQSIYQGN